MIAEMLYRRAVRLDAARTLLFVPGHRPDRFEKALASQADLVIADLEDAVAPEDKDGSREHVRAWSRMGEAVVRVNARSTRWFADDVRATSTALAIMLPKAESAEDVAAVHEAAGHPVRVIPQIESAAGVAMARQICAADGVERVAFGNVDLAASLGVDPSSHTALLAARSAVVYASAEAGCAPPIDGVTTSIDDDDALIADSKHARQLGFGARLCVHPRQVATVRTCMSPTEGELEWARGVLASTTGAVTVHEGQMIDEPVLIRARRLVVQQQTPTERR